MYTRILSALNIRKEEIRSALLLIGIMLCSAAGYTLGGTGVEALYFSRYGTGLLPYLYMALGVLSLVTSLTFTGLLGKVNRSRLYILIPLFTAAILILAWGLMFGKSRAIFSALWLGKEAVNTIISMTAWNAAGAVCDSRQAKRLFPLFNAARIFGAVLGGFGTGPLVNQIGAQNLVLAWAAFMAAAFLMMNLLMRGRNLEGGVQSSSRRRRRRSSFLKDMQAGWRYVRHSALMRWMSAAAILFSVLYFSIALPFSRATAARYPNEAGLASFLGLFNGLGTAAAFLASVFLANRLYARFGIMNMILALPLIYLFGFGALTISDSFAIIVVFRFVQTLWLSGIADAAYQTMFSAVPPEKRDQVNAFLNGVPEQAGVFLAGGLLIVGEQTLTTRQLHLTGLSAAIITTIIILQASKSYRGALVNSLREGRPTIFSGRAAQHESVSLSIITENLQTKDPIVRRTAVAMLAEMNMPDMLVPILQDEDHEVRLVALRGLKSHSPALLEVSALLNDPHPALRQQAIRTLAHLTPYPHALGIFLEPKLRDMDVYVQIEAAAALLGIGHHALAQNLLFTACAHESTEIRIHALNALAEVGGHESYAQIQKHLNDVQPAVRRAAALALAACGEDAIATLISKLEDNDSSVKEGAAIGLSRIGEAAKAPLVEALKNPQYADGALTALAFFSSSAYTADIKSFAESQARSAVHYHELQRRLARPQNGPLTLLKDSLHTHAHTLAIRSLRGLSLLQNRENIQTAIENLQSESAAQKANALETLETIRNVKFVKSLLAIWEAQPEETAAQNNPASQIQVVEELRNDPNAWLRACAEFVLEGEKMDTRTSLSIMERILFLRKVPLFADLPPVDLQQIAALLSEHHVEKDEVVFEQNETGDEMYIIVHGAVRIMVHAEEGRQKEVARRVEGDVVGEMSVITGHPRAAGLIAAEETHFLCLDKRSFESLMRERPEISLAIMRVLCKRLEEASK